MELNLFAVGAATLLSVALGVIWYSPYVCGAYWNQALGRTTEEELPYSAVVRLLALGTALQLIFFSALSYLFVVFSVQSESTLRAVLLSYGIMLIALTARFSIFEHRSLSLFFINSAYAVVSLIAGGYVIMYWPW